MDDITCILSNYKEFRRNYNTCSQMYLWSYKAIDDHSLLVSCHPTENDSERKRLIAYYFGSSGRGSTEKPTKLPKAKDIIIFRYENTFLVPSKFCTGLVTVPHNQVHYIKALKGSVYILVNPGMPITDSAESVVDSSYLKTFEFQKSTGNDDDCKAYAAGVQYVVMTTERSLFYYKIVQYVKPEEEPLDETTSDVKEEDLLSNIVQDTIMNPPPREDLPVIENTFPLEQHMFDSCDSQPDLLRNIIEESTFSCQNVDPQIDKPPQETPDDVPPQEAPGHDKVYQQNEPPTTQQQNEPVQQTYQPQQSFQPLLPPDQGTLVPITVIPITFFIPIGVVPQLAVSTNTCENFQQPYSWIPYQPPPTLWQPQQTLNQSL